MIGNSYLQALFECPDQNTAFNQLLEQLYSKNQDFINSLYDEVDLTKCTLEEMKYLTIVGALIDYFLQQMQLEVPNWLRDQKLVFDRPYYATKRLNDFSKLKLLYTCPGPFRARNVYFDLASIQRV